MFCHATSRFLSVIMVLIIPGMAIGQWMEFKGPHAAFVYDIEAFGEHLYAATDEGVYRTDDHGQTWAPINIGLPSSWHFREVAAAGRTFYALAETAELIPERDFSLHLPVSKISRVLLSRDEGRTWSEAHVGLPSEVSSLTVIGEAAFVIGIDLDGVVQDGPYADVYRRLPGDDRWVPISVAGLDEPEQSTLAGTGTHLFVSTSDGILRSSDLGNSWEVVLGEGDAADIWLAQKEAIADGFNFELIRSTERFLFAGIRIREKRLLKQLSRPGPAIARYEYFFALFRSRDRGDTWELINWERETDDWLSTEVTDVVEFDRSLFAVTYSGFFRSSNGGDSWRKANWGLPEDECDYWRTPLTSAAINRTLLAATCDGVYVSSDLGNHWFAANRGLPDNTYAENLTVIDNRVYASLGAEGLFVSADGAESWARWGFGMHPSPVYELMVAADTLFAHTPQGAYRFDADSNGWAPLKQVDLVHMGGNEEYLFLASSRDVYRSGDDGETWLRLDGPFGWGLMSLHVENHYIYVGAYEQGLSRSTDNGESWTKLSAESAGSRMGELYLCDGGDLTSVDGILFTNCYMGLFMSEDVGDTWESVGSGLHGPTFGSGTSKLVSTEGQLFVATEEGVFMLNPGELVWWQMNSGLPENELVWLDGGGTYVFAYSLDGRIWRLRTDALPASGE